MSEPKYFRCNQCNMELPVSALGKNYGPWCICNGCLAQGYGLEDYSQEDAWPHDAPHKYEPNTAIVNNAIVVIQNKRYHSLALAAIYSELAKKHELQLIMGYQSDEPSYFCLETIEQIEQIRKMLNIAEQGLKNSIF